MNNEGLTPILPTIEGKLDRDKKLKRKIEGLRGSLINE